MLWYCSILFYFESVCSVVNQTKNNSTFYCLKCIIQSFKLSLLTGLSELWFLHVRMFVHRLLFSNLLKGFMEQLLSSRRRTDVPLTYLTYIEYKNLHMCICSCLKFNFLMHKYLLKLLTDYWENKHCSMS